MDLTDSAPEGAGWYVQTHNDTTWTNNPKLVTSEQAAAIAAIFGQVFGEVSVSPEAIVKSGDNLIFTALQKQLKEAEDQASKIGILRKRIAEQENGTRKELNKE